MDSRINEIPERTFDLVLQIACPTSENEDPAVLWSFPQDYTDQEFLQTIPKFCFPFDVERVSQSQVGQNFTFVLTDIESKQRFGFCRLTSGCRVCICLLSYLPWFEIYYKFLNTLADYLTKNQENELNDMLNSLYSLPVPKPFTPVNLSVTALLHIATGQVLRDAPSRQPHSYFIAPDINGLPTIPESRNLTEYFVAVDVNNMLHLYASMLHERRIIITSSKLSTLTACVHGSAAMLFPMNWQHIYIPVLPPHLLDYCCAPMPYLVGVHLSLLERVRSRSLEDVVILNVDTNTLESPQDDLQNLPSDVVHSLKSKLKKQSTSTGSGVARAFLRAQAALFGSYRDALRYKPGEPVTFCEESFVAHRSSTMRNFLEMAVNLQLFKQFIDGRLAKLNAGRGFTDLFEEEISEGGFCGSNSRSYQQWVHTVKRGGVLINTAMTKAKSHAKRGIRRLKQRVTYEEEDNGPFCSGSPTSTKSLSPRRLQKRRHHYYAKSSMGCPDFAIDDDELDTASKISSEDSGEMPSYTEDSDDSYSLELDTDSSHTGQMNLLEEILDSLSTTSTEHGKLSAAKSLDFFRSMDDIDYKSPNKSNLHSESNLPQMCTSGSRVGGVGGGGEQGGSWQDDSALHGKHLPPSPRRQPSKSSLKKPKQNPLTASPPATAAVPAKDNKVPNLLPKIQALQTKTQPLHAKPPICLSKPRPEEPSLPTPPSPHLGDQNPSSSRSPAPTRASTHNPPPATHTSTLTRVRASTDPQPESETKPQTTSSILCGNVLSKETVRQDQALRRQGSQDKERQGVKAGQPSVPVPWERGRPEEGGQGLDQGLGLGLGKEQGRVFGAEVQEKGLLEEIESMCHLSSAFQTSLQLSQVQCHTNNTHNNTHANSHSKATDKS
ncbi:DENN domain-containing protein 1B isoform X1 [Oncorhynchus kisutch]|uniref:DENN domain-containing protein 1B isoform X1 n=1 Tax=Oncorhynchus kisutch TaxID=8019 RepID=UPI0012DC301B|nr:DENN domain-containing protein 1B-like isoform X1 [Oncorhynchus kisutch]